MANKEIRELEIQVNTVGTERAQKYLKQVAKGETDLTRLIEREAKKRRRIAEAEELAERKASKRSYYSRRRLKTAISQEAVSLGGRRRIAPTGPYAGLSKAEQRDLVNQMWDGRIRAPYKRENIRRSVAGKFTNKSRSSHAYVENTPIVNMGGIRGNYKRITASNSAFASGAMTPAMKKAQREFSAMVRKNTGLSRANIFGKSQFGPKDNTDKIAMGNLHAKALLMNSAYDKNAWNSAHAMNKAYDSKAWSEAQSMNKSYDAKAWKEAYSMNSAFDRGVADRASKKHARSQAWAKYNANKRKADANSLLERRKAFATNKGNVHKGILEFRNNVGSLGATLSQAVGELTMFAGAITMVGFMGVSAFQKLMAVGDAFAGAEKNVLTTEAFKNSLIRSGGIGAGRAFNKANLLNQQYGGMSSAQSGAQLARASSMIRNMGGSVNGTSMNNLVTAMHGAAAMTGEDSEKMLGKVLEVAKKGKGADKLGLSELKLTKNIDENIGIIANAIKRDPIAGAILRNGSVASAMAGIRSAPMGLMERVYGAHRNQITGAFSNVSKNLTGALTDDAVVTQWSRALTNLTDVMDKVLTRDRLQAAAMGAAQWAAELAELAGKALSFSLWFAENSDTVLKTLKWIGEGWLILQGIKGVVGVYKTVSDLRMLFAGISALCTAIEGVTTAGAIGTLVKMGLKFAPVAVPAAIAHGAVATHNAYSGMNQNLLGKYTSDPRWMNVLADNDGNTIDTYNFFRDEEAVNTPLINRRHSGADLTSNFGTGMGFNPDQKMILVNGNLTIGADVSQEEQFLKANTGAI